MSRTRIVVAEDDQTQLRAMVASIGDRFPDSEVVTFRSCLDLVDWLAANSHAASVSALVVDMMLEVASMPADDDGSGYLDRVMAEMASWETLCLANSVPIETSAPGAVCIAEMLRAVGSRDLRVIAYSILPPGDESIQFAPIQDILDDERVTYLEKALSFSPLVDELESILGPLN